MGRSRRAGDIVLLVSPWLGTALLALAARRPDLYRYLVREDSLLEWGQVIAYGAVVVLALVRAPSLYRRGDRAAASVLVVLAIGAVLAAGEELSWGQRVFDFGTPEAFSRNEQRETNLHNDQRLFESSHLAALLVGLYGLVASLAVRRSTPLAPPRVLWGFFAVVVAYFAVRIFFLPDPTYRQAKFSEWPELCLACAAALWAIALTTGRFGGASYNERNTHTGATRSRRGRFSG